MLTIVIPGDEYFDEEQDKFYTVGDVTLRFEHSLVSLSKWESKHKIPFLSVTHTKTTDQIFDYIKFMLVDPEVDPEVVHRCTPEQLEVIQQYIDSPESATTFGDMPGNKTRGETITSELIYYWLVAFTIPFEVEDWHLNRLFSLIRICNVKQQKPKKMSRHEIAERNRRLNAERRAALGTSG